MRRPNPPAQPKLSRVMDSVAVELELRSEFALALLTEGWTADELRALREGDPDAISAIEDEAIFRTKQRPDECDVNRMVILVNGEKVER